MSGSGSVPAKLAQILRLAMDRGAAEAEAFSAAKQLVALARSTGTTFEELAAAMGAESRPCEVCEARRRRSAEADEGSDDWWEAVTLPFGKHRGDTLREVVDEDPDYLEWFAENVEIRNARLKRAVEAAVEAV